MDGKKAKAMYPSLEM